MKRRLLVGAILAAAAAAAIAAWWWLDEPDFSFERRAPEHGSLAA